jgi:hypothetical protein
MWTGTTFGQGTMRFRGRGRRISRARFPGRTVAGAMGANKEGVVRREDTGARGRGRDRVAGRVWGCASNANLGHDALVARLDPGGVIHRQHLEESVPVHAPTPGGGAAEDLEHREHLQGTLQPGVRLKRPQQQRPCARVVLSPHPRRDRVPLRLLRLSILHLAPEEQGQRQALRLRRIFQLGFKRTQRGRA